MARAFGTGSPVWFRCTQDRRGIHHERNYTVQLTGNQRPSRIRGPLGSRSTFIDREYICNDCGHRGWSNHIDLARMAGEDRDAKLPNG